MRDQPCTNEDHLSFVREIQGGLWCYRCERSYEAEFRGLARLDAQPSEQDDGGTPAYPRLGCLPTMDEQERGFDLLDAPCGDDDG